MEMGRQMSQYETFLRGIVIVAGYGIPVDRPKRWVQRIASSTQTRTSSPRSTYTAYYATKSGMSNPRLSRRNASDWFWQRSHDRIICTQTLNLHIVQVCEMVCGIPVAVHFMLCQWILSG